MKMIQAYVHTDLSLLDLWIAFVGVGGSASPFKVLAHLESEDILCITEHNMLALALNEWYLDRDSDHPVAYRPLIDAA